MPTVNVKGMSCEHCKKSVMEAVAKVKGVTEVQVDLQAGLASWVNADPAAPAVVDDVKKAIKSIGFEAQASS